MQLRPAMFLSCALIMPAAAALGDASEQTIACSAQLQAGNVTYQVGQTALVQIAAVGRAPIDSLEIDGVSVDIGTPKQLLLRTLDVPLKTEGDTTIHVRVGSAGVYADCETGTLTVERLPTCDATQRPVTYTTSYNAVSLQLVAVTQAHTQNVVQCVDAFNSKH